MNVHLQKLEIIELLDQHKKITAVAETLGLKQPTVTFHMKSLEQELGVQLFETRSGKTMLTDAGQAFKHYAVKINALAREAERVVREFQELGQGTLRIGASYVPGTYILPNLISRFAKSYPRITLSLSVKTAPVIQEKLLNHEIDLGLFSTEPFQLPPLSAHALCEDELVVIFAPTHKLNEQPQLCTEMLAGEPFLMHSPESSTRGMTEKWARTNGVRLNAVMEMDSLEAIKQVAMKGEAISFLSRLAVQREVERGELVYRPIPQNDYKRYIYYAYNLNRHSSSLLDAFIDRLSELQ
ncbi:LysR substrate-binding domain-containing protein [Paenibacillus filicis]|uniref:LysR substrate-binding domain-containing protein n=1 Tax=Paenibacillus gyeongsangnamensis TaxID=3388067 RepID=A0ABT4Q4Y2_9BACL|nr:LysR substrate-binding domain-containing protein [Paenibacillus filicis]MCZ8511922.1 LysR substrate-binding domain-containing protein [Paenibacillus filicis]